MSLTPLDIQSSKKEILYPQNGSSFSPENGTNVIRVSLPNSKHILKSGSLRLTGSVAVSLDSASPAATENVSMNNWAGLQSLIDRVDIYSLKTGTLLESLNNYGHRMAIINAANTGPKELNESLFREIQTSSLPGLSQIQCQISADFSVEIMSGLLHASEQFSLDMVGGLLLQVTLNSNAQVLNLNAAVSKTPSFALSNVRFTANLLEPSDKWVMAAAQRFVKNGLNAKFPGTTSLLGQVVSNNDEIFNQVNFDQLRSVYWSLLNASDSHNKNSDSFALQVKDVTRCSMSVDGIQLPVKYAVTGTSDQQKCLFGRHALEAVSLSDRPSFDGVRTNISESNYTDDTDDTPAFCMGYLLDDQGTPMRNANVAVNVQSDISVQNLAYMFYDNVKTLSVSPTGMISVSH